MKDMRDMNGHGTVYEFMTTGDMCQMFKYNGSTFEATEDFKVIFPGMKEREQKKRWMDDFSVLSQPPVYRLG